MLFRTIAVERRKQRDSRQMPRRCRAGACSGEKHDEGAEKASVCRAFAVFCPRAGRGGTHAACPHEFPTPPVRAAPAPKRAAAAAQERRGRGEGW